MAGSRSDARKSLELIIANIRALHGPIENLINQFRKVIAQIDGKKQGGPHKQSGAYWTHVVFTDSLVRLRLFLEQNFNYIETMSLLAVTRYVFELTVWLKLIQKDSRYGFVYYRQLLTKQLDYYTELRAHLIREVEFLREMDVEENKLMEERLEEIKEIFEAEARKKALSRLSDDVMQEIDHVASRRFSLYGEQARTNGYGFQAFLVETKVLPDIEKSISGLKQELSNLEQEALPEIRALKVKRWRWDVQAALVDMKEEYDFIYSYASRLLHATPVSLTTDHKNLEPDEMIMFLKYTHVRLLDVIEMAKQMLITGSSLAAHESDGTNS